MKQLLLGFIFFASFLVSGQNGISSNSLADKSKKELMEMVKDLYDIEVNISYNITSNDLKSKREDMSDGKNYGKAYLNDLLEKMGNDSLNPIHLNNLADYYSKNKNVELANTFYVKALKNIDIKHFDKDSANYFSFRGLLKANLNDTTAISDFSKSVKINPNDSISMYFYPLILISSGKYQKAKELIKMLFNSQVENVSFPYLYLAMSEILESFQSATISITKNGGDMKKWANKNYNEIINYALLDEYLIINKGNLEIENCRLMADLLGLFFKVTLFETEGNHKIIFNYTDYEKNKLREIILNLNTLKEQQKLNEYTANRCLGHAYFMLDEWDKSVDYYKNAIQNFPIEKQDLEFNSIECYDAITSIYYQKSDTINFRKSINSKMAIKTKNENTIDELTVLAFYYYRSGDIVKAEEYCKKIKNISPDNFDASRLLSHINFLKGHMPFVKFYGKDAKRYIRNNLDYYNLIMQYTIQQIYDGDFNNSVNNIEIARKIKGDDGCQLCDKLMKIIEDNK
ncbi:hypothetical protein EC396_11370 [Lutibacter sp. HS1-25]|uniref:tetratricopeptide repeat protein n=1 Tax=Lutibacter sp. HS1-25 TaxID=2485000 RepID=UPI001010F36E|nr:hypothetical protein [Lutibacter sp. HS1-25]RXP52248.1 hypothetical protein EC396_11370 [Lutibacter sp. HS1-25]